MPRVRTGPYTRQRRRKWLSAARGYWGARSRTYRSARHQVVHGLVSAYRERRRKKRTFRALVITRINAALEPHDTSYSSFVYGLRLAGVDLDRNSLAQVAVTSPADFEVLVRLSRQALAARIAKQD